MELIHLLRQANIELLASACQLLARVDDRVYSDPAPDGSGHRVGAQFRHVIEFYVCLLDGLPARTVDYDARRRVLLFERSGSAALAKIKGLISALSDEQQFIDAPVAVRMEDAPEGCPAAWMRSSVARELQAVRSHTIHHFALIAMTLRAWGIEVDSTFGVAPSTLRYRERKTQAAA